MFFRPTFLVRYAFSWAGEGFRWLIGLRRPYSVLTLNLGGLFPEAPTAAWWTAPQPRSFVELVSVLRWARLDRQLKAVLLNLEDTHLGWAQAFELRRSIEQLRAAEKTVWVSVTAASIPEYVVATAANKIYLAPAGGVELSGLASETIFVARALEKLGIEPFFVQAGPYKTAAEVFTQTRMSAAHREMAEHLLEDLYTQILTAVADGRGWSIDRARSTCDRGPFSAAEALEAGLVDGLGYPLEVQEALQKEVSDQQAPIEFPAYFSRRRRELQRQSWRFGKQHLALVYVSGPIVLDGHGGLTPAGAVRLTSLRRTLQMLAKQREACAVVVRIASPGGSAVASDLLWYELQKVANAKPVVVSMGDLAASGGYYVALAGRPIVAESTTLTGSIGVLSGTFRLRGLYHWLGIDKDRVERGAHTHLHSDYCPLTEEEQAILQRHADQFYQRFLDLVARERDLRPDQLQQVCGGRVWTGRSAVNAGLVDAIGGLEYALDEAKRLAGYAPSDALPLVQYPRPRSFWQSLFAPRHGLPPLPLPPVSGIPHLHRPQLWAILPFRTTFF